MAERRAISSVLRIGAILVVGYLAVVAMAWLRQQSMLYFPSHDTLPTGLAPWSDGSRTIGFCREAPNARTIWLMMHGNGGQAADRDYVLERMSGQDSLYVLEYPGYGSREGSPSLESMNRAASEAYRLLRARNPKTPVCVLGESLGSGPACALAGEKIAPDKIVLVTPFDVLANVGARHFPFLPVRLLLRDNWDNVTSLKRYTGPVEIFGAKDDTIIPVGFARALAKQIPGAQFIEIPGGHNEWSRQEQVKIKL
ncbi:MAG: alpha/beta hydrolase [Verrucomicrobiota bacterium]|jgi:pimeloyl-ACP methyl ester carboxylesterase